MTINRKKFAKKLGVPEKMTANGRHSLIRLEAESTPYKKWNCFIDIISADPNTFQLGLVRFASLAFLYESEVQNGGHDQYFENTSGAFAEETILALEHIGDGCRANVLAKAYAKYRASSDSKFADDDIQFHACAPELIEVLERHFEQNEPLYIEWK